MSTTLITVLLCVMNAEKTLDKTLESLQRQTLQNFDIVVVNDGSTDGTAKVLQKWQKIFGQDRMKVLEDKTNIGLTKSLNRGLKEIKTPYTARIDADDWWDKKKLAKQLSFLQNNSDYGIIGCNYVNISSAGERRITVPETDEEIRRNMVKRNPFAHSCVIFSTALVKKLGGYDEAVLYGQDYELWFRCQPYTKFYNLREFLCNRTVGSGISVDRQRQQMVQVVKTRLIYIRKYHLPLISYFYLFEPLSIILLPNFLKKLKRKVAG